MSVREIARRRVPLSHVCGGKAWQRRQPSNRNRASLVRVQDCVRHFAQFRALDLHAVWAIGDGKRFDRDDAQRLFEARERCAAGGKYFLFVWVCAGNRADERKCDAFAVVFGGNGLRPRSLPAETAENFRSPSGIYEKPAEAKGCRRCAVYRQSLKRGTLGEVAGFEETVRSKSKRRRCFIVEIAIEQRRRAQAQFAVPAAVQRLAAFGIADGKLGCV